MAYYEMLKRDHERFVQSKERLDQNPLGAGALAGTSFNIDRFQTTKILGFKEPTKNSLDTVSDRDFIMDFIFSSSMCSLHLSRLAEEFILWSSDLIKFIDLGDNVLSSSSIMPQKKNPDAMELVRAKASIIISNLSAIQNIMKGLPLSYSKDLQEDKSLLTNTCKNLKLSIDCMIDVIDSLKLNKKNMENAIKSSYSNATELADWFVKNLGYSFRVAHGLTAKIVNFAEQRGIQLNELELNEYQEFDININESVYSAIDYKMSVDNKRSYGGTSRLEVRKMIKLAKKEIQK
jgi:argininosuccinate lyase